MKRIMIFGANGAGKTTLGKECSRLLQIPHLDIEDYAFLPSPIPYTMPRFKEDCRQLLMADLLKHPACIFTAVQGDFGEEFFTSFGLAVYLYAPVEIRIERIQKRSLQQYGERILNGGDMARQQAKFLRFAASRSIEHIVEWGNSFSCPMLCLDGRKPIPDNARLIAEQYRNLPDF